MKRFTLITGASSGLGKEFALICAKEGHNLILVARSEDELREIQRHIEKDFRVEVILACIDLSDSKSISQIEVIISKCQAFVNVFIHAAGMGCIGRFPDVDIRKNLAVIDINVVSGVRLTHSVLQQMIQNDEGRILFVSSTAAFAPGPWFSVYHASKVFISSFAIALSRELRGSKVKATLLCPGQMRTKFQSAAGIIEIDTTCKTSSPAKVAEIGFAAMLKGKRVCVCGIMNQLKAAALKYLPHSIGLFMVTRNNIRKIPIENRNRPI
jgi:short-subunit dehydrogenase